MRISERFRESFRFITYKILWIILFPILLDLVSLFIWEKIFHTMYNPAEKLFLIKLGFIGAPPSVQFLLEDFPSPLLKYDSSGMTGIINGLTLFNVALLITIMLIISFINSGYMSIIGTSSSEKIKVREFFIKGNKRWHKFFILGCLSWIPMLITIFNRDFMFLSFISVIFVYVKYSFVIDEVGILENFKLGILFLFKNFGLTIKMALYFGLIFSLISLVVLPIARFGNIGVVIDIVICAYLGACVNRAVMDIYRYTGEE